MHNEAATVVAPSAFWTQATARSRAETLRTPVRFRKRSRSTSSRPTESRPLTTAVMAGTAPAPSTAAFIREAACRLAGIGSPCASTELSSATTGRRAAMASATGAEMRSADMAGNLAVRASSRLEMVPTIKGTHGSLPSCVSTRVPSTSAWSVPECSAPHGSSNPSLRRGRRRPTGPGVHDRLSHVRHHHLGFVVDQPALVLVLLREDARHHAALQREEGALGAHLVRLARLVRHVEPHHVALHLLEVRVVRQDVQHRAV